MVTVSLTVKDNKTGGYYTIPVLPERIEYQTGEKKANTVEVLNLGDVDFLGGVGLDTFGWASEFPARYDSSYVQLSQVHSPKTYKDQFTKWKNEGTPMQLVCPAAGINKRMYIQSFSWDLRGAEGDIYYEVVFKELKTVKPKKISSAAPTPPKKNTPRPAAAKPAKKSATYKVVKGDYLIKIAKRKGIKNWRKDLYLPNKKPKGPLGSNPDLIYPGQVLKLP